MGDNMDRDDGYSGGRDRADSHSGGRDRDRDYNDRGRGGGYRNDRDGGRDFRDRDNFRERREERKNQIYVGNLPNDVREREIDDLFYKFGRIKRVDVRQGKGGPRATSFAFVTFDDARDAEDAVHGRNDSKFGGLRIRCEVSRPVSERRRDADFRGDRGDRDDRRDGDRSRGPPREKRERVRREKVIPTRSNFGIVITGYGERTKWKDLKTHCQIAGNVVYANVEESFAVVEFETQEELDGAIEKLDGTEFKEAKISVRLAEVGVECGEGTGRRGRFKKDEDKKEGETEAEAQVVEAEGEAAEADVQEEEVERGDGDEN